MLHVSCSMNKAYEPKQYEDEIYQRWEASGFFDPDVCIEKGITKEDAEPFSIILPPPNVTGTLHIGHAVMLAIEDVMVRYHRMKGDRTLWVPGTDHAAIATQEKVERKLWDEEEKTRHDLGRERFLKLVEDYAEKSHDRIVKQAKKMGASMDWSREYYSLDDERNLAVRTAFKRMYDAGLIYRGDRIVNWDPKMQSNVSDIEVVRKEEKAPFYYFQYGPFEIGTSRPETKFGDKYVVVHPDDKRYEKYKHGDTFECEWINGKIMATIIKDEAVDMEFGTGVMTITPWHDVTDFFIAERHGLDKEQVIDFEGKLLSIAGEFAGMPILEARSKIVEKLETKGLVTRVDENYLHSIATNSRGGGLIEPQIMKQWWMDVKKKFVPHCAGSRSSGEIRNSAIEGIENGSQTSIQELSQHVVRSKQIDILPERFEKNYFNWVDNLLDWCLSRQLWYGHRVPAWYCKKAECRMPRRSGIPHNAGQNAESVVVSIEEPEVCPYCGGELEQDPDTLDTWFSAGMFSFTPLGGVDGESEDQKNYHPTSVLETGYDILTFWVVRMIMMTTYLRGEIPFKTVYLHGLVRDEQGRKMSKSLDNIIDPLDVAEKFGTDAVRLSLIIGSTPGTDSKLSEEKIGGYRNFTNKLWNIARFMIGKIQDTNYKIQIDIEKPEAKTLADRWILARLDTVIEEITEDIEQFRFSQAGEKLRDFTWNEVADWYLEVAKIEGEKSAVLNYVLNAVLKLWHPYMPFVTEQIWSTVYGLQSTDMLMIQPWPKYVIPSETSEGRTSEVEGSRGNGEISPLASGLGRDDVVSKFTILQNIITGIRSLRAEYNIEPGKKITAVIVAKDNQTLFDENAHIVKGLARVESLTITANETDKPKDAVGFVVGEVSVYIDLAGAVDSEKEKARLQKEIDTVAPFVVLLEKKLNNKGFTDNAPEAVLDGEKKKLEDAKEKLKKLEDQISHL